MLKPNVLQLIGSFHEGGTILTPERLSNLAWGDADAMGLYTTSGTMVTHIRVKVAGIRP